MLFLNFPLKYQKKLYIISHSKVKAKTIREQKNFIYDKIYFIENNKIKFDFEYYEEKENRYG